ncbi:MAG TPA: type II and III secretion system protein family protein [Microvirga sp.]|nr:type II and III secretion system protein family protein [Microvirga sp.]
MTTRARTVPLLLAGVLIGMPSPALANGVSKGAGSTVLAVQVDQQAATQRVDLSIGRSLVIELPRDAKEVFVANPKVANAVVRSTRKVFVIGMDNGATSIFVMDAEGRQIAALEVNVGRDLNVLTQTLRTALPQAQIQVRPAGSSVLLTGTVASAIDAQQAVDIANAFVAVSAEGGVATKGAVINALTIRGKDQVMLQVTVVEVARTVLKQFGINTSGSWSALGGGDNFQTVNPFTVNPAANPGSFLSASVSRGGFSARATLQAFERAGVSRVLAEPTLTAISGESAKFTAGGEIPIPKSEDCERGRGCTIGVEYKPYGVTLSFTPIVLSENRISLRISTEVTEVDPENQFRIGVISVPAMKVRKAETTVELPSGAVLMTAGLIQQASSQAINGLPGLLNLPVLGALFRSRDYQRKETELMVMVTPMIAKPMNPTQVARPDDGFVDAHDGQALLLGRLNRLYGVTRAAPVKVRAKGQFGFITD